MKKIPTLFKRCPDDRRHVIAGEVTPGCEWVLAGEGVATRKWDGTCWMLDDAGAWWARREVKPGKTPPPGWREIDRDETTGKRVGWEPIEQSGFAKLWREVVRRAAKFPQYPDPPLDVIDWLPGTYELVGPKINGNPEGLDVHDLEPHGSTFFSASGYVFPGVTERITVADLIEACRFRGWEGIVWWRDPGDPDCDKAKLKVRDFPEVNPA